ncbi:phosphotransferase family protein [Virgibacillus salexigens]|uniref:phosphotransferase family protein n=1 Tax=Virgibacillus salexigens TaxID=61016 RepID=UPI00190D7D9F|nr:phosphotransferase family protein [Virgibacillus salexigens]
MKASQETIQVRKGEELNKDRLAAFITGHLPEVPEGELQIEQFGAGHSNLTYLLRIGDWEAVLRRPPFGPVAPKAHDMQRECKILASLHPFYPAAPKPYIFSDDISIVGSNFFIMERRKGIVVDTEFPDNITYTPAIGKRISKLMVEKLAELHQIDYTKTDLVTMSKPDGFMERQVGGWTKRYERAKTEEIPGVDELTNWLKLNIPTSENPAIIHYDYKMNNAMYSEDFTTLEGLFDWEMTTVGDPLADVGVALVYWMESTDPEMIKNGFGKPPVTIKEGFFTREEFMNEYAKKSGKDLSNMHFYLTFAYFKLAVICQQIYYRYHQGQTNDERFRHLNHYVASLIEYARSYSKGVVK